MAVNLPIQRLSGFGLVFYALTVTFAGIDWIMSINPHWYSTLFGFLMLGGQGLSALAFTIIASRFLSQRAPMQELLKPHHFHDLGKLSLAFVMLWAYFNFSQFLLTYAANLIEELPYFLARMTTAGSTWRVFLVALPLLRAVLPAAVARQQAHAEPAGRGGLLDPVHALHRPLHAGVARVLDARARTCTCWRASTPAGSSCTGSTWRRRPASAVSGCGCSRRS